ncbi:MAG TPA: transglycosylase domain-containing protein, partial [Leptospiraceae bacterium]|nr:transglycosylase domain-containing protein [Leptospiraceae bacterium]
MQPASSESSELKKFVHVCPACQNRYRVTIQVKVYKVHRAACPVCGNVNYFDNRRGLLDRQGNASAPRPAQDVVYPEPPTTKKKIKTRGILDGPLFWTRGSKSTGASRRFSTWSLPELSGRTLILGGAFLGLIPIVMFLALQIVPSVFLPEGGDTYLSGLTTIRENRILDRKGRLVGELFSRKTGNLKYSEIPGSFRDILLFVEDEHFYSHGGVHWPSVVRAFARNVTSMGYSQGGSTLTQQLARILLNARQKTLLRKVRETSLAYYIEGHMSKEDIFTAYVNQVYLGHGAVGADNAARFYFLKGIADLNFAQMLALSCLPSAPEMYSPLRYPDRIERKMDAVFARMKSEGFSGAAEITQEQYESQKAAMLSNTTRSPSETVFGNREDIAPYVSEHVRNKIGELFGVEQEFGAGLQIETTIDADLQNSANTSTAEFLASAQGNFPPVRKGNPGSSEDALKRAIVDEYFHMGLGAVMLGMPSSSQSEHTSETVLQGASVGIDPRTGAVLYMQGGRSFRRDNQINRAVSMRRQTGSAIKPIIYSAGIETGEITAASRLDDSPVFVFHGGQGPREFWLPENITGEYKGKISAREALAQSRNVPAILVGRQVGLPRLSGQFRKFFFPDDSTFDRRFRMDETIAIGSLEMSPLEMAVAFAAFADNGTIHRPYLILRIKDTSGKILYENDGSQDEFGTHLPLMSRVLPGDVAEVMSSMLRDSAAFANTGVFSGLLMGKTGTTNEYRDAWFVGAIPGLSASAWVGYDNPTYSMQGGMGARLAGPLFGRIVSRSGFSPNGSYAFSPSAERIRICKESGKISGPKCPSVTELFASV